MLNPVTSPKPMGHEYCGIVEEVGRSVTSIKKGQFVIGSFFGRAVGLLGVLSARHMGAGRIIAMSRHAARQTRRSSVWARTRR